jgi:hypothetical protein
MCPHSLPSGEFVLVGLLSCCFANDGGLGLPADAEGGRPAWAKALYSWRSSYHF